MRSLFASVSLLLALPLVGCPVSVPADLGDCPDGSTVTWTTVEPVFADNCTRCHSTSLVGSADRLSAPEDWDYDTADASVRDPDESWRRIYIENMPPDAEMSDADKLLVWEWYSCDAPN
ncbi:MAG: hypothetical protein KDA24_24460 [Deltaproteobacteria bacterium]|nr:hypothetical protein [Deltaproteobacteria bacterium]